MRTQEEIKAAAAVRHRARPKSAVRKLQGQPLRVWGVRLLLMVLGVILVHSLWPMPLEASRGWGGVLRAGLGGVVGVFLWSGFDYLRQLFKPRPPAV